MATSTSPSPRSAEPCPLFNERLRAARTAQSLSLRKLAPDYDPTDPIAAIAYLQARQAAGEVVTGLVYVQPGSEDLHDRLGTVERPLNQLTDEDLVPGRAALDVVEALLGQVLGRVHVDARRRDEPEHEQVALVDAVPEPAEQAR